jgi:hypothetical protein
MLVETKKLKGVDRLDFICAKVRDFVCSVKGSIRATREDFSFSSKGRSVFDLGALGGCVDLTMFRMAADGIAQIKSYHKIPPTVHKKYCVLNGAAVKGTNKAEKLVYLTLIKERTGESFSDDNVADSYMLARTLRAICLIASDEQLFAGMCDKQKEALVASGYMQDNGLTPGKLKKMEQQEYAAAVLAGVAKTYTVFECGTGNV